MCALRIFLRDKPPSNPAQDGADSLPSVRMIQLVRHAPNLEHDRCRNLRSQLRGSTYDR